MELTDAHRVLDTRWDDYGADLAALVCPSCEGTYTHQKAVRIYARLNDERRGGERVDLYTGETEKIPGRGNPSSRRQGLMIEFRCESCDLDSVLAIYQHKGITFIGWVKPRQRADADATSTDG